MSEPRSSASFSASDQASVGVQADTIHGDINFYTLPANPSPEEKFRIGVRYLQGRMAGTARTLIHQAVAEGHITNESVFYWLLSMFSNRTLRQLTDDERAQLRHPPMVLDVHGSDDWADAVRLIVGLLRSLDKTTADSSSETMKTLDRLAAPQRTEIVTHLELLLEGWMEDRMWHLSLAQAQEQRLALERVERVWKFFQPEPARPRVRNPQPVVISRRTWVWLATATALSALAAGYIALLLAVHGAAVGLSAFLSAVVGGYGWAVLGTRWRFCARRLRAKDDEYLAPGRDRPDAPAGGFAAQVDHLFDRYFALYVPDGVDRTTWVNETAGFRRSLREEIVEVYRESRIPAKNVAWLIRFRVSQVRSGWSGRTLLDYQNELRTPFSTKALAVVGFAILIVGGGWAVFDALRVDPLHTLAATFVLVLAGKSAAGGWSGIVLTHRSFVSDTAESERRLADGQAAYVRWVAKLADKPSDTEMAAWLDCDRKVLMKCALERYKLKASGIRAHAFIEAPGPNSSRARIKNGPWRYSRYILLVFVLTIDGVRQITVDLDFATGMFRGEARINYRFDAVASVEVVHGDGGQRTFELSLLNSHSIKVQVTEPDMRTLPEESAGNVSEVTLDSAGLNTTLHVLEGIAAEGKSWIDREDERRGELTSPLFSTS